MKKPSRADSTTGKPFKPPGRRQWKHVAWLFVPHIVLVALFALEVGKRSTPLVDLMILIVVVIVIVEGLVFVGIGAVSWSAPPLRRFVRQRQGTATGAAAENP
jgi:hypothetical protein